MRLCIIAGGGGSEAASAGVALVVVDDCPTDRLASSKVCRMDSTDVDTLE